jgi:hypothetical protein
MALRLRLVGRLLVAACLCGWVVVLQAVPSAVFASGPLCDQSLQAYARHYVAAAPSAQNNFTGGTLWGSTGALGPGPMALTDSCWAGFGNAVSQSGVGGPFVALLADVGPGEPTAYVQQYFSHDAGAVLEVGIGGMSWQGPPSGQIRTNVGTVTINGDGSCADGDADELAGGAGSDVHAGADEYAVSDVHQCAGWHGHADAGCNVWRLRWGAFDASAGLDAGYWGLLRQCAATYEWLGGGYGRRLQCGR